MEEDGAKDRTMTHSASSGLLTSGFAIIDREINLYLV